MAVKDLKINLQNHEFPSYCSAPKHGPATISRVSLFIVSVLLCSSPPDVPRAMMSVHGNRTLGNRALPRATERRDQSDPILSRSGHGGRVSLFLLFFSPLFHLSYEYKNLGPGPLGFSPCHPSWIMTEEHFRGKSETETLLRALLMRTTWNSVIESVQYYSRQTRVCIFPVSN